MLGLTWLLSQIMAFLKVWRYRKALAVSLAALTVAASVNAFYTPQSFYWLLRHLRRYTFPLALFTVYLALMLNDAVRGPALNYLADRVSARRHVYLLYIRRLF